MRARLRRSPGFAITAVLILGLAMGASTAVFSVIEASLLRPLPYREAERLAVLWKSVPQRQLEWDWTSYPTIRDWNERNRVFEKMAFILRPDGARVLLDTGGRVERLRGTKVSGNFFDLLDVPAVRGRTFNAAEASHKEQLAVLSHGFWTRRLGGDPNIIGTSLRIDNRSATVVGVMPPQFQYPDEHTDLWLPMESDPRWEAFQKVRFADAFSAIGRLRPGVTIQQARAEMDRVATELAAEYRATDADLGVRVVPMMEQIAGKSIRLAMWLMAATVFCVLLIACSNVAGLLVARNAARGRELAVKAALGASRARLAWDVASESIAVSLAGGALGVLVAASGLRLLAARIPESIPRANGITMNATALGFAFAMTLVMAFLLGILPALRILDQNTHGRLYAGTRSSSPGPRVRRFRGLLVAAQFALTVTLLAGAGLFIRSFLLLHAVDPGFDVSHLVRADLELPGQGISPAMEDAAVWNFHQEALRRVEAIPGVKRAAIGESVFGSLRDHVPNQNLVIEGRPAAQEVERHQALVVSDEYFAVMGIPLRQGRLFSSSEIRAARPSVVINETMARRYWPDESAVGKRFKQSLPGFEASWLTVIGVVKDVIYNHDGAPAATFYWSDRQRTFANRMPMVVRTSVEPESVVAAIREAILSLDRGLPYFEIDTVAHKRLELDRSRELQVKALGGFAIVALTLSLIGLYGLMSYSVQQRRREIGIRMALGANPRGVRGLVLADGLRWVVCGAAAGVAGSALVARAAGEYLYGVRPGDPVTLAATVLVLAVTAGFAAWVPATRAARLDPVVTLREE